MTKSHWNNYISFYYVLNLHKILTIKVIFETGSIISMMFAKLVFFLLYNITFQLLDN